MDAPPVSNSSTVSRTGWVSAEDKVEKETDGEDEEDENGDAMPRVLSVQASFVISDFLGE
jgi:hypothetical protein